MPPSSRAAAARCRMFAKGVEGYAWAARPILVQARTKGAPSPCSSSGALRFPRPGVGCVVFGELLEALLGPRWGVKLNRDQLGAFVRLPRVLRVRRDDHDLLRTEALVFPVERK